MTEENLISVVERLVEKVKYLENELEELRENCISHSHPKCLCMNRYGGT